MCGNIMWADKIYRFKANDQRPIKLTAGQRNAGSIEMHNVVIYNYMTHRREENSAQKRKFCDPKLSLNQRNYIKKKKKV